MTKQAMRVWFVLFVALVFAAGVAAGMMVGPRLRPWPPATRALAVRGEGPRGLPGMRGRLAPFLAEELGLDADQQKQLAEVLAKRRERFEVMQRDLRQQYEDEQKELREDIRAILRPDQMSKFEEWLKRAPRRRPGPGGPEGRPGFPGPGGGSPPPR
jgi:hypothetical protein